MFKKKKKEACVQAQVTIHTAPPGNLCSPLLPGSSDPGTASPAERTARLRLVKGHAGLCCCRLVPHSVPLPPGRVSQTPESAAPLTPSCVSEEQTPSGDLYAEAGPNPELNPRSSENKEEKGKSLPAASGAAD